MMKADILFIFSRANCKECVRRPWPQSSTREGEEGDTTHFADRSTYLWQTFNANAVYYPCSRSAVFPHA